MLLCDHCSADSSKGMGTKLEKVRFYLPHGDRLMKECPDDQLLQGKRRFRNEIGMLQVEVLALEKEKVHLQNEIDVLLLLLLVFLTINYILISCF